MYAQPRTSTGGLSAAAAAAAALALALALALVSSPLFSTLLVSFVPLILLTNFYSEPLVRFVRLPDIHGTNSHAHLLR